MVLDEQELRRHLAAAAGRVSTPRFTMDGLISRIRRRRAKILGLVSGSLLAVAALAVAVPVALSGPATPPVSHPVKPAFQLSFMVAVNGQPRVDVKNGPQPRFTITPGKHVRMNIDVIVPAHAKVTTLWLGITKGIVGFADPHGQRPSAMRPVLVHTRTPLTPGPHMFKLAWMMPTHLAGGTRLWLAADWATKKPDMRVGQTIIEFDTPR